MDSSDCYVSINLFPSPIYNKSNYRYFRSRNSPYITMSHIKTIVQLFIYLRIFLFVSSVKSGENLEILSPDILFFPVYL